MRYCAYNRTKFTIHNYKIAVKFLVKRFFQGNTATISISAPERSNESITRDGDLEDKW